MPQAAPSTLAGEIVGSSSLTVWSLPSAERLRRLLRRAGATAESGATRCLLLRADWVYDEVLVKSLARRDADAHDSSVEIRRNRMARIGAVVSWPRYS